MDTTLTQNKFLSLLNRPSTIIDIGGGKKQIHANYFRKHGHTVKVNDFFPNSDYKGKFIDIEFCSVNLCTYIPPEGVVCVILSASIVTSSSVIFTTCVSDFNILSIAGDSFGVL